MEDDAPTRKQIEDELNKIKKVKSKNKQEDKDARNLERKQKVAELVSPEIFKKIETDLPSYMGWESDKVVVLDET